MSTARNIVLQGLGHYLPARVVTNDDLRPEFAAAGNAVDDAVLGEIRVTTRRWSSEEETVEHMAVMAARMAMEQAGVSPASVDLLLLTNWTSRLYLPELAPRVAHALGIQRAMAFDLCGACTGFILGVITAVSYLRAGTCKRAVVVSSDQFSRGTRPGSRGRLVVGDAAGAVVLEARASEGSGILDFCLHAEGDLAGLLTCRLPSPWVRSKMELAEYAINRTVAAAEELLDRNQLAVRDLDWVIAHPGTDAVQQGVRERLGIPAERFAQNFTSYGNTSSASIPIVLSELHQKGQLQPGQLVLTPAVGAGFYHGALLFRR